MHRIFVFYQLLKEQEKNCFTLDTDNFIPKIVYEQKWSRASLLPLWDASSKGSQRIASEESV